MSCCKKCYKSPCCCSGHNHGHEPSLSHAHGHGLDHNHEHDHATLAIDAQGHIHGCNRCHHHPCTCGHSHTHTQSESLPSTIDNFIKHFFGSVVKTCVNGKVVWTLPCDLDAGLENNPRLAGEGLACYFKRLFEQGIVGLTGPQGNPGDAGADGNNAYTVTLASFAQPSAANPNVQVLTAYNPAIFEGLTIYIQTSGYYFVNATDGNGTLFLTLIDAADGAPAIITAGKLVTSTGPQGTGTQGPKGDQGLTGEQGPPGESFTATNGMFNTFTGTEYNPGVTYAAVNFTSAVAQVTLPAQGTYELTATAGLLGKATIADGDVVEVKLQDTTVSFAIESGESRQSNIEDQERTQLVIHCLYTTDSANHNVQLQAKCTTAGAIGIMPLHTNITFVRLE